MSLLNEMLKNINQNKARANVTPFFHLPARKRFSLKVFIYAFWVLIPLIILASIWVKPLKLNGSIFSRLPKISISNGLAKPLQIENSALNVKSAPPSSQIVALKLSLLSVLPQVPTFSPILDEFSTVNALQETSSAEVKKVFANLTDLEQHDDVLNQAMDAIENDNGIQAAELLEALLLRFPKSQIARETLASLYLSEGDYMQASRVVDQGLVLHANSFVINTLKARILFEQNQAHEALQRITRFHPDIRENSDFYGLKAAIFESLKQWDEARSLYKTLVEIEPMNGQYWLGYAMALEQKHATQQAIIAYRRAGQSYDIDPAVRAYAENRLKILQG